MKELQVAYRNISRVIHLTDDEKRIFESLIEVICVDRNSLLLREGRICLYEYFVLKGCLRSYYVDDNLVQHTTMFAVEGWWTGNLESFVKNTPSEISIEAHEASIIFRLNRSNLQVLYTKVPKFERYFRILLQNRLLATQRRINAHLASSASHRFRQFLIQYPELEQRVPLKHIASYLGITATYLSRLRKQRR